MDPVVSCEAVLQMPAVVSADACAAARAVLRASEIQAKAVRSAGHWTAVAGLAAIVAAAVALAGVRLAAYCDNVMARSDREFQVRREVYFGVSDALFSGLLTVTRLSDFERSIGEAMADYLERLPQLGRAHMVANPDDVPLILTSVNRLAATHAEIIRHRLAIEASNNGPTLPAQAALNKACLDLLPSLHDPLLKTVAALRGSLGLPVNLGELKAAVDNASKAAQEQAAGFFGHLVSDLDIPRRSPVRC